MKSIYDSLPSSFSDVLSQINQQASSFGIDAETLGALLLQPLVSDNFNDAQQITGVRMDDLRQASREHGSDIMRLLCHLSMGQLATFIKRFNSAETPYQHTRWRIVLCGDDSLLVHAEESQQTGVVNIWSTLYKTYRKAHDLIVLGVTIGPGKGTFFFPLWVELWRQPSLRKQTRPQRMAAALLRLRRKLKEYDVSLCGLDFVVDNGYLSPVVVKAVNQCGLIMTSNARYNEKLSLLSGEQKEASEIKQMLSVNPPRFDVRAGEQGYYWRIDTVHPRMGKGTLVIQRRKLRNGKYKHRYYFSQHQNAKGITVLQIAKRRWPTEVFFREGKQKIGLGHLSYRKWQSLRGHVALRGLLYWLLSNTRRCLRLKQKTIGALKRRWQDKLLFAFSCLVSSS
jgi:hypothetical protein